MTNFIHIWKHAIPNDICDEVIKVFEDIISEFPDSVLSGRGQYSNTNMMRDDLAIALDPYQPSLCKLLYDRIWKCYDEYKREYGQLQPFKHEISNLKVQKTMPYGGFHAWHFEQAGPIECIKRELVWTIYLNTMPPNEAETEFLYQAAKVQPQKGAVCIFPAAMTHVHRGLTVYTQPKYIITGWFSRVIREDQKVDKRQLTFNF